VENFLFSIIKSRRIESETTNARQIEREKNEQWHEK
jgi:hypothetical protein